MEEGPVEKKILPMREGREDLRGAGRREILEDPKGRVEGFFVRSRKRLSPEEGGGFPSPEGSLLLRQREKERSAPPDRRRSRR